MTVEEYTEQVALAEDAANRALDTGDMDTHIEWACAYHRLAENCKREHGIELRPEADSRGRPQCSCAPEQIEEEGHPDA